jgi:hypothetical protein
VPARLQADGTADLTIRPPQGDDGIAFGDGFPTKPRDQLLHQRAHASWPIVRDRAQRVGMEQDFLVLSPDAPIGFRFLTFGNPSHEIGFRADRLTGSTGLACRHAGVSRSFEFVLENQAKWL